jgi:hypothetical protein
LYYPLYNVAVKHAAKLCKYMPAHGWEPVILTKNWTRDMAPEDAAFGGHLEPDRVSADIGFEPTVVHAPYQSRENALLRAHVRLRDRTVRGDAAGVPHTVARKVLSAGYSAFGHYPDEYVGWVEPATRYGIRAVEQLGIDAILSSCPPTTGHLVGSGIARRSGLPWVALFGDLFGFYVGEGDLYTTPWRRRIARILNARWMRPATRVAAVSPAMVDYLQRTYDVPGEVVVVGFDPDESPNVATRRDRTKFRLVYTGSMYIGDQRPEVLFDAIDVLCMRRPDVATRLEVLLVGTRRETELKRMLVSRWADAVCRVVPRVGPDEAIALQHEADALLILNLTNAATVNGTLSYPSKIFEYLQARRPILAIPPDPGGWVTKVIDSTKSGVSLASIDEIATQLELWVDEWDARGSIPFRGDTYTIDRFSCDAHAAKLCGLLDEAARVRAASGADLERSGAPIP